MPRPPVLAAILVAVTLVVLARPAPGGPVTPTSWWLAAPPSGRTIDVAVLVDAGACEQLERVAALEHARRVRVEATVSRRPPRDGACGSGLTTVPVQVRLEQPLGERTLTGCARRDDRLYPAPSSCEVVGTPGPVPHPGQVRPPATD